MRVIFKGTKKPVCAFLCLVIVFITAFSYGIAASDGISVLLEDGLNIRNAPGTDAKVVYTTGKEITATAYGLYLDSKGNLWYKVKLPSGIEGYAHSNYVHEQGVIYSGDFSADKRVMVTGSFVNVRKGPGTDYERIDRVWSCSVQYLGKETVGGETWYKTVTPGGKQGYIRGDLIAEYTYGTDSAFEQSIADFPESYKIGLRYLHSRHPNWVFYADKLSISLESAAKAEKGKKLLSEYYSDLPESWRSSYSEATVEPGYTPASELCLTYFMNPAYFICENSIFMFLKHSFDPDVQTKAGVKTIVKGSFLDTEEYAEIIMNAAAYSKVSPYVIAATILQEQGRNGSALSSGNYSGYEGYYNFFNFGASGNTDEEIIVSGLLFAKNNGWDSPQKAISEGAKEYASGYVSDNQDTYYYGNFNVINKSWNYQYATNIHDSISKAANAAVAYTDKNAAAVFRIPVFTDSENTLKPHTHTYDNGVITVKPTETSSGKKVYTCSECGFIKEELLSSDSLYGNKGDINGDGKIDAIDGARLRMYFLKLKTFDKYEEYRADINNDGKIDAIDGARMRMHFLNLKEIEW